MLSVPRREGTTYVFHVLDQADAGLDDHGKGRRCRGPRRSKKKRFPTPVRIFGRRRWCWRGCHIQDLVVLERCGHVPHTLRAHLRGHRIERAVQGQVWLMHVHGTGICPEKPFPTARRQPRTRAAQGLTVQSRPSRCRITAVDHNRGNAKPRFGL